ncbi:MAG: hypothetical protein ABJP66_19780 [Hyphomicrobiales bacterium]
MAEDVMLVALAKWCQIKRLLSVKMKPEKSANSKRLNKVAAVLNERSIKQHPVKPPAVSTVCDYWC